MRSKKMEISPQTQLTRDEDEDQTAMINGKPMDPMLGEFAHACCSACCVLFLSLPFLVIPTMKGGDQFCNGYWKNQTHAQLGGMVKFNAFPLIYVSKNSNHYSIM